MPQLWGESVAYRFSIFIFINRTLSGGSATTTHRIVMAYFGWKTVFCAAFLPPDFDFVVGDGSATSYRLWILWFWDTVQRCLTFSFDDKILQQNTCVVRKNVCGKDRNL